MVLSEFQAKWKLICLIIILLIYFIQYFERNQWKNVINSLDKADQINLKDHHHYHQNHNIHRRLQKQKRFKGVRTKLYHRVNGTANFDLANSMEAPANSEKIFLFQALRYIETAQQLAFFNGPRTKQIFDTTNSKPHILLNRKLGVGNWDQFLLKVESYFNLTEANINNSASSSESTAVHIHNEEKIGDLLLLVIEVHKRKHKVRYPRPEESLRLDRKAIQEIVNRSPVRLAFTNTVDENWGFLSSNVGTRTTKWINMTNHLRIHYSDYSTLRYFLDSEKVLLMTANTHVDPSIGFHEKVICLPLGIKSREELFRQAKLLLSFNITKTKLLTINNSGWGDRTLINEMVSKAFHNTTKNSYRRNKKREFPSTIPSDLLQNLTFNNIDNHIYEIAASKFVLCPSGLGMDTYRLWETLLLGSIPIVESNAGLDRTYSMLPVLVIPNYSLLTPSLLEESFSCFQKHILQFNYRLLLENYWIELIYHSIQENSIDLLSHNHPPKNPYCNFF